MDIKHFLLRIREDTFEHVKTIAKRNNRSINETMIELLLNGIVKDMGVQENEQSKSGSTKTIICQF